MGVTEVESRAYGRGQALATLGGIVGFWGSGLAINVMTWGDRAAVGYIPLGVIAIGSWLALVTANVIDARRGAGTEFRWIDLWLMRGPTRDALPRDVGIDASARALGLPPRATRRTIWALGAVAIGSVVVRWFV